MPTIFSVLGYGGVIDYARSNAKRRHTADVTAVIEYRKHLSTKLDQFSSVNYISKDILCGRGGLANKHSGNRVYRRLVEHRKGLYNKLSSRNEKKLLVESIVSAVKNNGGRFLKQDDSTKAWFEIDDKEAFIKTRQAFCGTERKKNEHTSDASYSASTSTPENSTSLNDNIDEGCLWRVLNDDALDFEMDPLSTFPLDMTSTFFEHESDVPTREPAQSPNSTAFDTPNHVPTETDNKVARGHAICSPALRPNSSTHLDHSNNNLNRTPHNHGHLDTSTPCLALRATSPVHFLNQALAGPQCPHAALHEGDNSEAVHLPSLLTMNTSASPPICDDVLMGQESLCTDLARSPPSPAPIFDRAPLSLPTQVPQV